MTVTPDQIANLVRWYKGDTLAGVDGTAVSSWPDSSPSAANATQATGSKQPKLYNNVVGGAKVVRFDGLSQDLVFAGLVLNDFSAFFLCKNTGDGALLGGAFSTPQLRVGQAADKLSTYDGTNNPLSSATPTPQTSFSVLEFVRAGATVSWYQYGTALATGPMTGPNTFDEIGSFNNQSAVFLNGDIAEIVVFSRALTATERYQMEDYLFGKYLATAKPLGATVAGVGSLPATATRLRSIGAAITGVGAMPAVAATRLRSIGAAIAGAGSIVADLLGPAFSFLVIGDTALGDVTVSDAALGSVAISDVEVGA